MQGKVQRWGNSLAVRIPKVFALDVGIEEDTAAELLMRDGGLIISPRGA